MHVDQQLIIGLRTHAVPRTLRRSSWCRKCSHATCALVHLYHPESQPAPRIVYMASLLLMRTRSDVLSPQVTAGTVWVWVDNGASINVSHHQGASCPLGLLWPHPLPSCTRDHAARCWSASNWVNLYCTAQLRCMDVRTCTVNCNHAQDRVALTRWQMRLDISNPSRSPELLLAAEGKRVQALLIHGTRLHRWSQARQIWVSATV